MSCSISPHLLPAPRVWERWNILLWACPISSSSSPPEPQSFSYSFSALQGWRTPRKQQGSHLGILFSYISRCKEVTWLGKVKAFSWLELRMPPWPVTSLTWHMLSIWKPFVTLSFQSLEAADVITDVEDTLKRLTLQSSFFFCLFMFWCTVPKLANFPKKHISIFWIYWRYEGGRGFCRMCSCSFEVFYLHFVLAFFKMFRQFVTSKKKLTNCQDHCVAVRLMWVCIYFAHSMHPSYAHRAGTFTTATGTKSAI